MMGVKGREEGQCDYELRREKQEVEWKDIKREGKKDRKGKNRKRVKIGWARWGGKERVISSKRESEEEYQAVPA